MNAETPLETARRVWPGAWESDTYGLGTLLIRPMLRDGAKTGWCVEVCVNADGKITKSQLIGRASSGGSVVVLSSNSARWPLVNGLRKTREALAWWLAPMVEAAQQGVERD